MATPPIGAPIKTTWAFRQHAAVNAVPGSFANHGTDSSKVCPKITHNFFLEFEDGSDNCYGNPPGDLHVLFICLLWFLCMWPTREFNLPHDGLQTGQICPGKTTKQRKQSFRSLQEDSLKLVFDCSTVFCIFGLGGTRNIGFMFIFWSGC